MYITASIYSLEQLNRLKGNIDAAILMVPKMAILSKTRFDVLKAISICKEANILPILGMNKLITPKEIEKFREALVAYLKTGCYFYFADLGAVKMARDLGIMDKVIYDPETMITNYLDASIYASMGMDAVGISSEIPLVDVSKIVEAISNYSFYQLFGYRKMMISKRPLISLYGKHAKVKVKTNTIYTLKEATREDYFPFVETENGVSLYRSYVISMLENLNELKKLKYGFIETAFLPDSTTKKVTQLFHQLVHNKVSLEEAKALWSSLGLNSQEGFKMMDSVYQKECF